jgi:hypothetical protein
MKKQGVEGIWHLLDEKTGGGSEMFITRESAAR